MGACMSFLPTDNLSLHDKLALTEDCIISSYLVVLVRLPGQIVNAWSGEMT